MKGLAAVDLTFWQRVLDDNPDVHPLVLALDFADSYTRASALVELYWALADTGMSIAEWFAELGGNWTLCDNLYTHAAFFRKVLHHAPRTHLDAMMAPEEREAFDRLPQILTVYRGCYGFNRNGLSWSLSRDVAEQFVTTLWRYRRPGLTGLLLTGRVNKNNCVLKLGRAEQEVIAPRVRVTGQLVVADLEQAA